MSSSKKTREMALIQLRKIYRKMISSEWTEALKRQPTAEKEAKRMLLDVYEAHLRLGNKQLAEILDKLKENEESLNKGKEALDEALNNLQDVQKVLETTAAFLKIVGKVVTLAV